MNRVFRACVILASLLMTAPRLGAWDSAFFDLFKIPYSTEAAALGGVHAAYADGLDALFSNPALFRSVGPELSFAQATLSIYDSALMIVDEVLSGDPSVGGNILRRAGINLMGPLSVGYVGNGLGFGLFTDTTVRYWTWGPYPFGISAVYQNLVLISGYAFRIPFRESALDIGFSIPVFITTLSNTTADVRGLLASQITLTDFLTYQPMTLAKGASIEAGILYSVGDVFALGIMARNLAYVARSSYLTMQGFFSGEQAVSNMDIPLPMEVTVGIKVSPPINRVLHSVDRLTIMVDYNNIFDFITYEPGATNPLLHIGIGLEVQMLDILQLRAGFYQLLPAGGVSIDLTIFKLNLAVFGRELTREPWGYPIWGFLVGLTF
jgi:hypothetical protein